MSRYRLFLLAAVAFLANSFPVGAASAPAKLVIAYAAMSPRVAPLWAAQERGFFTKNGINAELVFVRGAPTLLAALSSGDMHFGLTGGTAVLGAAVAGFDLKILAVLTNQVTLDLVARPGIKSVEELRGKRFGTAAIGGTLWMSAILGLERLGLDVNRDDIRFLAIGDAAVLSQALEDGRVDAALVDMVFSRRLHDKGFPILAELGKYNIPISSLGVVARSSYIQQNSQVTENLMSALLEGIAFVHAPGNKPATLQLLQRRLRVSPSEAEEGFKDMALGLDRKPYPSLEGLRNIQRLMKIRNPKVENTKVEELVDDRILRKLDESGFIDRLYNASPAH
ncbi:MAG: ABC-type nitrate/sulfonate/bicarbonate transport system, periplasmic component [Deltaproteobacteria bacterium]|jgi:NitT/TauT family transport system substrate-binding protein|nr:ABC-type nitrate/sulfonate/bicarbonate transport system, periplasmic component [Deltaproteobacteria bacterium]